MKNKHGCRQKYVRLSFKGRDNLGDMDVDGNIILKCVVGCESLNWIKLVLDRVQ
jgi:hypothetical protein